MRHEIISLKDLKGLYLLRAQIQKMTSKWVKKIMWSTFTGRLTEFKPEKAPLRFSWIKEYMFIYLQTDYEMHWILRIFYRNFWISIFKHVFLWGNNYRCEPVRDRIVFYELKRAFEQLAFHGDGWCRTRIGNQRINELIPYCWAMDLDISVKLCNQWQAITRDTKKKTLLNP